MQPNVSERDDRVRKLNELKQLNINPFPAHTDRNCTIKEVIDNFKGYEKKQNEIIIAGRLRTMRTHGNLCFANLDDGTGVIQIAISKQEVGETYKNFIKLIDMADFIEIKGVCFVTHKGENSILTKNWKLLTKTLRPLPDKWHGLVNKEEILRKRYLDILCNDEVKDMIQKKSKFWNATRNFLIARDFLEVETPF
ncbi:MAG: OB-fold nucleic acid binding domain-containing protein [Candidatus Falkowbacteria bacterium]|nr:OB-fold nucleic acid binding domain-containing protein [Candidatus Falkowbacteria bacterium]